MKELSANHENLMGIRQKITIVTDSGEETVWAIREPIRSFMKKCCLTEDVIAACQNHNNQCPSCLFIVEADTST